MCGGPPKSEASLAIDKEIAKNRKELSREYKLLLLGAGESGKSTVAKQMQIIHLTEGGGAFSDKEIADYVPCIYHNIVNSLDAVLTYMETKETPTELSCDESKAAADVVRKANNTSINEFTPELAAAVKQLVNNDAGVKVALENTHEFQFPEAALYFFQEVDRIAAPDYKPTTKDILSARRRTTGIKEMIFLSGGITYRLIDVGGQRSERKKWFHCFEDVTAILFIVAISEYNLVLFEDEKVNRTHDSLALFGEIANSKWFTKTSIILFLNKKDLFEEKIKKYDLKVCFPNYNGGDDYEKALAYMKKKFLQQNKSEKTIYVHPTCAMDTKNIEVVFNAVKDTIQQQMMTAV